MGVWPREMATPGEQPSDPGVEQSWTLRQLMRKTGGLGLGGAWDRSQGGVWGGLLEDRLQRGICGPWGRGQTRQRTELGCRGPGGLVGGGTRRGTTEVGGSEGLNWCGHRHAGSKVTRGRGWGAEE